MTTKLEAQLQAVLILAHKNFERGLKVHAFFRVPDQSMSEDLVQETFMKTWRYLLRGGKIELMKAFLYHVLNNLIVDEYRKPKTISLDVLLEKGFEPGTDTTPQLFNLMDGKVAILLIRQLPEKYRKVMRMRYVQDLTLKEISILTKQTKNAVTVQTHRGLKKLKILYDTKGTLKEQKSV